PTPAPRAAPAPVARSPEPPPWVDAPDESELAEPAGLPAPEVPEPRPRAVVATVATVVAVATTPLGDRWTALVKRLVEAGAIGALVRELAMQSECIGFDEARIVLRVDRETLRSAANVDKLGAAIAQVLGRAVALQVEAGTPEDSPARRDAAERARRQAEAEQIIADDPLVKALMAQYKTARIVPGSIKPH
ncbi:MAG TPA: DNA polymerase III subunit gamma/tau C-terminal domain-containing protein, partial [Piscinibacter sp.]|nr:DNA polymerase III subunit gamma/tau C-terminal domain-containing protein [Piscinibacter sp.]